MSDFGRQDKVVGKGVAFSGASPTTSHHAPSHERTENAQAKQTAGVPPVSGPCEGWTSPGALDFAELYADEARPSARYGLSSAKSLPAQHGKTDAAARKSDAPPLSDGLSAPDVLPAGPSSVWADENLSLSEKPRKAQVPQEPHSLRDSAHAEDPPPDEGTPPDGAGGTSDPPPMAPAPPNVPTSPSVPSVPGSDPPSLPSGGKDHSAAPAAAAAPAASPEAHPDRAASSQPDAKTEPAMSDAGSASTAVDAIGRFIALPPTQQAQQAMLLGPQVAAAASQEHAATVKNVPQLQAKLDGEPQTTKTEQPSAVVPAAKSALDIRPTEPPLAPQPLPPTQLGKAQLPSLPVLRTDEKQQPAPDSLKEAVRSIPTRDGDIKVTPTPKPQISLAGSADPARMSEQQTHSTGEIAAAVAKGQVSVDQLRGEELLKRASVDKSFTATLAPYAPTYSTKQVPEQTQYLDLGLPMEVMAQFDTMNQSRMQASLQGARSAMDAAASERDRQREEALGGAKAKTEEANSQAQKQQEELLAKSKEQIQSEREKTKQQYQIEQQKFDTQAKAKLAQSDQSIKQRVAQDQQRIDSEYKRAEQDATKKVEEGESKAEEEKRKAEEAERNQSWWQRLIGFFVDLFRAIVKLIVQIFDAIRQVVASILDKVKELATAIIDAVCNFVQSVISAIGEFLKAAVDALLGSVFPGLANALKELIDRAVQATNRAVQSLGEELKAKVSALVDGIKGTMDAIISTFDIAANAALSIAYAVMTGDWKGMLRQVLEAVLKLAGVDAATFEAVMSKAEVALDLILRQPFQFIGNLIKAVVDGFAQFARNFAKHLRNGLGQWLTGVVSDTGLQLPQTFDAAGIFSLVVQILGLTKENLRQLLIKQLGPQKVHLVERVWAEVELLLQGGWAALWERVAGYLGNLYDQVLQSVSNWLMQEVIEAAIAKISSLFVPVAGLIEAISTVGRIATFLREQMARIAQLLVTVISGLYDVATGNTAAISTGIEGALASLLGVAINLLAQLLGIGNIGQQIKQIITTLQSQVWDGIERFVQELMHKISTDGNNRNEPTTKDTNQNSDLLSFEFDANQVKHNLFVTNTGTVDMASTRARLIEKAESEQESNRGKENNATQSEILDNIRSQTIQLEAEAVRFTSTNNAKKSESSPSQVQSQSVDNKQNTSSLSVINFMVEVIIKLVQRYMNLTGMSDIGTNKPGAKPKAQDIFSIISSPNFDVLYKYTSVEFCLIDNHEAERQRSNNGWTRTKWTVMKNDGKAASNDDIWSYGGFASNHTWQFLNTGIYIVSAEPSVNGRRVGKYTKKVTILDIGKTKEHQALTDKAQATRLQKGKFAATDDMKIELKRIREQIKPGEKIPEYVKNNNKIITELDDRLQNIFELKLVIESAGKTYGVPVEIILGNVFFELGRFLTQDPESGQTRGPGQISIKAAANVLGYDAAAAPYSDPVKKMIINTIKDKRNNIFIVAAHVKKLQDGDARNLNNDDVQALIAVRYRWFPRITMAEMKDPKRNKFDARPGEGFKDDQDDWYPHGNIARNTGKYLKKIFNLQ